MNEKYYIIYFDVPLLKIKPLIDRLAKLGDRVFLNDTLYVVKSSLSALEIYQRFTAPPFDGHNFGLFITEFNPSAGNTFGSWGVDLWRFLGLYEEPKDEEEKRDQ